MSLSVLAIQRAPQFSPNSVGKDLAILTAVAERLRTKGHEVVVVSETALPTLSLCLSSLKAILSMGRLPGTLQWIEGTLAGYRTLFPSHNSQLITINSPEAVDICSNRSRLVSEMRRTGIPLPPEEGCHGYWLKRGDTCAQTEDDVRFAANSEEKAIRLQEFALRGINDVVVQAHVEGDLVKFYGVLGTGFFRYYYPTDDGQTKFGDEQHNGQAHHYSFSPTHLQQESERLATAISLHAFGGDAIIRPDGSFCIIDFNDWPSFSRCREEAAEAIASLIPPPAGQESKKD